MEKEQEQMITGGVGEEKRRKRRRHPREEVELKKMKEVEDKRFVQAC